MRCGVRCRSSSDLALLWLWCRLAATAQIRPLAWEPPHAAGAALKRLKTYTCIHTTADYGSFFLSHLCIHSTKAYLHTTPLCCISRLPRIQPIGSIGLTFLYYLQCTLKSKDMRGCNIYKIVYFSAGDLLQNKVKWVVWRLLKYCLQGRTSGFQQELYAKNHLPQTSLSLIIPKPWLPVLYSCFVPVA